MSHVKIHQRKKKKRPTPKPKHKGERSSKEIVRVEIHDRKGYRH